MGAVEPEVAVRKAGRGCGTAVCCRTNCRTGWIWSSFVLDMSLCLSSGEAIYVGLRCPFEVIVSRKPLNLEVNALPGMYSAM